MKTLYKIAMSLSLLVSVAVKGQLSTTLTPVEDAYFISMGGGQGDNPMLKFNISSIPPGSMISSAILKVYVFDTLGATHAGPVLGNMIFRNLNNRQSWMETDSAYSFAPNQNVYSDTVTQLTGFGDSIGWATSSDLKSIVIKDYNLSNSYCTISMKDPDDVTCCGAMGPNSSFFLGNSMDTIISGNKLVGCDQMMFRPKNYLNPQLRPYLIIQYTCDKFSNQTLSVCFGDSVNVGNTFHKMTGIYHDTLTGIFGCDSIVTTDLTIDPAITGSQNITLCAGDSIIVGTSIYKTGGTYHDTLTAAAGCDSVVTTNLTVNATIDTSVFVSGNTLTSNQNGATYQWIDCNNSNLPIGGETGQAFTASLSGDYAVIVTKNNCSGTSTCANIVSTQIDRINNTGISFHPNPVKDILYVNTGSNVTQITLSDVLGRVVYQSNNIGKVQINIGNENKGLYLLKISSKNKETIYKVIKD